MKTDSRPRAPAAPDYEAFFLVLDEPVALCDTRLRLVRANPAFERFCAAHATSVAQLAEALRGAPLPAPGASCDVQVPVPGGGVVLTLSGGAEVVAVRGRYEPELARSRLVLAERALLEQARAEGVLLELSRSVAEAAGEEDLVAAVARGVKELFPARAFCIRIVDARTGGLTSLYAEGRLKEGAHEPLVLKPTALERTHLSEEALPAGRVVLSREVPLLFVHSTRGVSAPLVCSGQLFGAINMEYPEGLAADIPHDERLLIQLANQVAVAVRNAKLIDELTFVRQYLEELLEKANALILVTNRERQVVVFNQALGALTGLGRQQVLGQDVLGLFPEDEHLRVAPLFAAAMRGEPVPNFETRLRSRGGEVRAAFATSTVRTSQGEVEGVMVIGQDITVLKELEKRIIHAEKLAGIGQLAASVAHEINNPMTAVATYADALLQRARLTPGAPAADMEKLQRIVEASQRILRFTQDLVSYARPAKERPELVRLEALLEQALGYCEHVVGQSKVRVQRDFQPVAPLPAVRANLVQVFVNLVTNACQSMAPGGTLFLSLHPEGREAVVRVRDTGSGIQPQHLSRIFEPFFTTKPEGKGTGLGLSIVQGIVEAHGGRMAVHSQPGQGTTFSVHLPLAQPG